MLNKMNTNRLLDVAEEAITDLVYRLKGAEDVVNFFDTEGVVYRVLFYVLW